MSSPSETIFGLQSNCKGPLPHHTPSPLRTPFRPRTLGQLRPWLHREPIAFLTLSCSLVAIQHQIYFLWLLLSLLFIYLFSIVSHPCPFVTLPCCP